MDSTTFENTGVFLPEADQAVKAFHDTCGQLGSSLLSIRTDLKTLAVSCPPHACGVGLMEYHRSCKEQYVMRFKNHTLKVEIQSHKPGATLRRTITKPDTAKKVQLLIESLNKHVANEYKAALSQFFMAVFKHNSEGVLLEADAYEDEWSMYYYDAKQRTTALIDLYPTEEVVTVKKAGRPKKEAVPA